MKQKWPIQNLKISLIAFAAVVITGSCQKVINIDLQTANSIVVIQAYVTDQPGIDTVKLNYTGSYYNPGHYPAITNAVVVITDNTGAVDTFMQVDSGVYASTHLTGIPGNTYTMKVFANGKEYDAVSTMPAPVDIDSLQIASEEPNFINRGDTTFQRFRCYFKDPAGIGNFYQAQAIVNGKLMDSVQNISVLSDKYVDGIEVEMRIRGVSANSGDSVQVNLMCIDAANYDYFTVLRSLSRSNPVSTAVPQNPPTNIQGGAIGYFSARPVRSQTIFVP